MSFMNAKEARPVDDSSALVPFGWAPGGYHCAACSMCGEAHSGSDKRSSRCQDCAEKVRNDSQTAPMPETMSPREKVRKAIIDVMKPHDADVTLGRVDLTADTILAALTSSGDHAGLKRLADEAADFGVPAKVDPAVLNALIAENAALRETNTEAERKLAEAAGLLRDAADGNPLNVDWGRIDAFLSSKEAER